jgi:hypothetical protein
MSGTTVSAADRRSRTGVVHRITVSRALVGLEGLADSLDWSERRVGSIHDWRRRFARPHQKARTGGIV